MTSLTPTKLSETSKMTLFQGKALVVLLCVIIQGVVSSPDLCRDALAPPSKPRGVNQVDRTSATPLFELHVTPIEIKENSGKLTGYKVGVSIADGKQFHFREATLAVSTNGSCGSGDFDFRIDDYTEIVQDQGERCPRLIQTRRETHMTELLPMIWIPPPCGCVTLRMLLVEAGDIYYAENEAVTNGYLAKTICFKQRKQKHITREDRLDSLCHVIDKHSSSEILSRSQFQRHRELKARWMDHLGLEMALELRRNDVRTCCTMILDEDKARCFDNARRRRIDQFCEDGMPDIPFRTFRRSHMRSLEKSCCFILGEFRYKCFAKNSQLSARGEDTTTLFDYSMDASDLANDLAEFGSHEHLDSFLKPIQLGEDESSDDNDEEDEDEFELDLVDDEIDDDSEEDVDNDDGYVTDMTSPLTKRPIVQKAPSRYNNDRYNIQNPSLISPTPTYTNTAARSSGALSQKDIKKLMRRKSKGRNSKENRRMSSAEKKKGRRGGRRKSGRRGSAERRTSAERRVSLERRASAERRASSERRGSLERRASAERRNRFRKMPQQFDDRYLEADNRDTFYQRGFDDTEARTDQRSRYHNTRGHRRQPATLDKDMVTPNQYGFEDQGGSSMDRTLIKLQKKMKRLKLLNMCCQAGADMGRQVYGGIASVTDECRHSSHKFIRGVSLGGKTRKCVGQFVDCCLEEAKKGLTMTSQEFIENTRFDYWENAQQYDPGLLDQVLALRRTPAKQATPGGRRPATSRTNKEVKVDASKITSNDRKNNFDQEVDSVKEGVAIRQSSRTNPKSEGIDTTPKENTNIKQDKTRQQPVPKLAKIPVLKDEKGQKSAERLTTTLSSILVRQNGATDQREQKERMLSTTNAAVPGKPVPSRIVPVESEVLPVGGKRKGKSSGITDRPAKILQKELSKNVSEDAVHVTKNTEDGNGASKNSGLSQSDKNTAVKETPKQKQQIDTPAKEELENKPVAERKISSERKSVKDMKSKDKDVSGIEPLRLSPQQPGPPKAIMTNGQAATGNRQRQEDLARTRDRQRQRKRYNNRSKSQRRRKYKSRVVALDSREMAERNTKQYIDALDSREMADQYISKNNGRWYRKGMRNYRYATPSLSKHHRRSRFG